MKKEIFLKSPSDLEREQEMRPLSESLEDFLHAFDQSLEEFILNVQPVNEGRRGLIFHLKKEDIPKHLLSELEEYGIEFKKAGSAIKALKIFSPGDGEAEYERQRDAYFVLRDARKNTEKLFASVPEPLLFRSLNISEQTRRALNGRHAHLLERRCEIILMDFIEGEDLLEKLFRLTLAHSGAHKEEEGEDLKKKKFVDLWLAVADFFHARTPLGLLEDETSRELERLKKRCYDFLGKKGVFVHPRVVEQVENAVDELHRAGIRHNDLHERNIMLSGELDDPNAKVLLIDFAYVRNEGFLSASRSFEEGRRRISDSAVPKRLRALIKDAGKKERHEGEQASAERFRRLLQENETFRAYYEGIKKEAADPERKQGFMRMLEQRWRSAGSEKQIDQFFAAVRGLCEEKIITLREAGNTLEGLSRLPAATPYNKKRLREFQEQLLKSSGGGL